VAGQVFEFTEFYRHGLKLSTNLFGSSFFVLTGIHGAHVTVESSGCCRCGACRRRGGSPSSNSEKVEIAGLYWHFVDIVWIVFFTVVYLIP